MGEIIPGVDPREKMASDYGTKGVHSETVTKWQTVRFFLSELCSFNEHTTLLFYVQTTAFMIPNFNVNITESTS